jgi:hypothetical protein
MSKIFDESSLRNCVSQLFNAMPSTRTSTFLVSVLLFQHLPKALTNFQQEPPSPAPSLPAPKSKLHKRKDALLSLTAALARETIKFVSSLHSTPSNPPSRSLHHGVSPNSTSDSQAATISSTTPRRQESPSAAQRASHGVWTRTWHTAVTRLVSWRTPMSLPHPTCGS